MTKRRRMPFSVRVGLLVVAALCVALSLWVALDRQRRAVAAIKALGGHVSYMDQQKRTNESFLMEFLRRWLPQDYLDEVEFVRLRRGTDAGLVHLQRLTTLQLLSLENTQVTDAGLAQLRKDLPNCGIVDGIVVRTW